jgi:hypothetical protein
MIRDFYDDSGSVVTVVFSYAEIKFALGYKLTCKLFWVTSCTHTLFTGTGGFV